MEVNWNDVRPDDLPLELREIRDDLGMEVVQYLVECWGGASIYVPSLRRLRLNQLTDRVRREYDGSNEAHLARKYRVSRRVIRDVLIKENCQTKPAGKTQ